MSLQNIIISAIFNFAEVTSLYDITKVSAGNPSEFQWLTGLFFLLLKKGLSINEVKS